MHTAKSVVKGCVMKKKFLSKDHAESFAHKFTQYLRAYKCDRCVNWHLTSSLPKPKRYVADFSKYFEQLDDLKIEIYEFIDYISEYRNTT